MSYTYRRNGTPEQQTERHKQKLVQGILLFRKAIAGISGKITALGSQTDQEIARAIWDGVDVGTVASAAGITHAKARSIGLSFEDLPNSGASSTTLVRTLWAFTQQAQRLNAEQEESRQQQERLIVTALETRLLDAPWVVTVSGLTVEQVNILARHTRQYRTTPQHTAPTHLNAPRPSHQNLGDEKKQ